MNPNKEITQDDVNTYRELKAKGLSQVKITVAMGVNHRRMMRIKDKSEWQLEVEKKAA